MVNLLGEIERLLGPDFAPAAGGYRYTVFGDYACFVDGVKGVIAYGDDSVTVRVRGAILAITGVGLTLAMLDGEDLLVKGKFLNVARTAEHA